jgi:hypothetical protein
VKSKKKNLTVEDEPDILDLLGDAFQYGFEVQLESEPGISLTITLETMMLSYWISWLDKSDGISLYRKLKAKN